MLKINSFNTRLWSLDPDAESDMNINNKIPSTINDGKGKGWKSHHVILIRRGIGCGSVENNVTIFVSMNPRTV